MAPSTSRAFASWTPLDLTSRISWPAGIVWIPPRLKAPVVNPFPYVYVHVSPVPPLRDPVVTFSHGCLPHPRGAAPTRAFMACVQRGNYLPCESLGIPPECDDSPPGGANTFLGFFIFLEYPSSTTRRRTGGRRDATGGDGDTVRKFRTRNENQTRIAADLVRTRDLVSFLRARVSLCARWLETKLVKLHPHVETWTFQRVYKVPLARPCQSVRRPRFVFLMTFPSSAR